VTAPQTISRASVGLRSERGPILLSVMLSTALIALDSTILATAIPKVVEDLGGFNQFQWLFSVYLLVQAVTVPIFGRLADIWGRKPVMQLGVLVFLLGSLLCGLAWGMLPLIIFRAIQGIGAGAVAPIGMTIMGDIYSVAERAKAQGYIASVWAMASLVGPLLGGVFSDYASWRWIFFVNLPIGAIALWMMQRHFHEKVEHREHKIDYLGSTLLTVAGVTLLLALIEGGVQWPWLSPVSFTLIAVAVLSFVGFALAERRAPEPVLPLWAFRNKVIVASFVSGFIVSTAMMGLSSYVPLFGQVVLGHNAVVSGLALAAMTFGWPISASQAGRIYLTFGYRACFAIGATLAILGGLMLLTIDGSSSVWHLAFPGFVIGLGFGSIMAPGLIAAQSSVEWQHRGMATGTSMLGRNMGSSVGVALFGAVANSVIRDRLHGHVPADLETVSKGILEPAIHSVFIFTAIVLALLAFTVFLMPSHRHITPSDA